MVKCAAGQSARCMPLPYDGVRNAVIHALGGIDQDAIAHRIVGDRHPSSMSARLSETQRRSCDCCRRKCSAGAGSAMLLSAASMTRQPALPAGMHLQIFAVCLSWKFGRSLLQIWPLPESWQTQLGRRLSYRRAGPWAPRQLQGHSWPS